MFNTLVRMIKKVTLAIWCLFLILLGFMLVIENSAGIEVMLLGMPLPKLSLGIYIAIILLVGVLLGFVTSYIAVKGKGWSQSRELNKAKKEVAMLRQNQF